MKSSSIALLSSRWIEAQTRPHRAMLSGFIFRAAYRAPRETQIPEAWTEYYHKPATLSMHHLMYLPDYTVGPRPKRAHYSLIMHFTLCMMYLIKGIDIWADDMTAFVALYSL